MSVESDLQVRSEGKCELCTSTKNLLVYAVEPSDGSVDQSLMLCGNCHNQIEGNTDLDKHHWRCLSDSMWAPVPAIQAMVWRMLTRLCGVGEGWAQDQLDMLYLDDETQIWAEQAIINDEPDLKHQDSNGAYLQAGDTVTLIKDLNVKGAGFTAKRGTAVRNISLSPDNEKHIEGRVNGQQIVILTEFVKKSG